MSEVLDATGLICPLPVLRARKALRVLAPGARLVVHATDPAAPRDFEAFCREGGHRLVSVEQAAGGVVVTLEKGRG